MRSSTSALPRGPGLERRDSDDVDSVDNVDNVDNVTRDGASWPFAGNGKDAVLEDESGVASSSGAKSMSFDILAQEVEDLIERQPQFAFLKPCRQLEQHFANKRNSTGDSGSFRHSQATTEAKSTSKDKNLRELMQSNTASSSGRGEDAHQKPKTSTVRELLSCEGIELTGFTVEGKPGAPGASSTARVVTKEYTGAGQANRNGKYGHFHRNSGERIWRISSTRCSIHEKEAHIDLVNPAAAKFLMEMSPNANASPPAVAIPFKWERAPGRAKDHSEATMNPTLQLPPRLVAVPRSDTAFSRQLQVSVISHPLAGFFPCMGIASSPSPTRPAIQQYRQQQQQEQLTWMHYRASKSYGGVYQQARKHQSKSFSQPLAATEQSMGPKPRRHCSSDLGRGASSTGASTSSSSSNLHSSSSNLHSSSSILHGSQQCSSSRTYLSCELGASTPRTAGSKSSSSISYESVGEDFDHDDGNASPHYPTSAPPALSSRRHRRSESKGLLKLCKSHGNCLRKSKSRRRICSPEVWAPTLATYFQRLDVNEEPLLEKQGPAPTSSGYLNSKGEPQPLRDPRDPDLRDADLRDPNLTHGENCGGACGGADGVASSPEISPKRPTRLPYKMPTLAEQELGRCRSRHRGTLSMDFQCPSPAYAAALEMLSPAAVTLMASRRHQRAGPRTVAPPKPHRRVQFILSMCKTLKRVLFRQQPRRSVIGTRLMYHDDHAPTTFQFSKPN